MQSSNYSLREMMAIMAAREIKDGDIVFAGTGISMLAATAAKNINAPNSVIFFETGAIDSLVEELPLAVADPRVMYAAASNAEEEVAHRVGNPRGEQDHFERNKCGDGSCDVLVDEPHKGSSVGLGCLCGWNVRKCVVRTHEGPFSA